MLWRLSKIKATTVATVRHDDSSVRMNRVNKADLVDKFMENPEAVTRS